MSEDIAERRNCFTILQKFGFTPHPNNNDFLNLCHGLNLFLCICGHGLVPFKQQQEGLGEKIRYAETIIQGLEACGCKLGLSPHQITGTDWKALRPVIE
jgi:hypothetical protein